MKKGAPLKLGFIGGALDSAVGYTHFAACKMDNRWRLVAGCLSIDKKVNKETARIFDVPDNSVCDKWEDFVDKEKNNIDAVVVLTPTPTHYDIVKKCLNESLPVICEKALVENSGKADEINKVLKEKKGFLAVTYNYSGYPMVRELRNMIIKGLLGKILHFQVEMPQEGFIRVDSKGNKMVPQQWRLVDKNVPTLYLDLAVHLHQLINYLTGLKPMKVISSQNNYGLFPNIIDNVNCICKYNNNVEGHIWFSKSSLGHRNGLRIRIFGDNASAEWFQCNPEELVISHKDGRIEIVDRASNVKVSNKQRYTRFKAGHPAGYIEAFANLYYDIADCLQQYKSTGKWSSDDVFGAELAAEGLRMSEAMVMSAKKSAWQEV